jgi:hypothetical protein
MVTLRRKMMLHLWARQTVLAEPPRPPDERRVRDFLASPAGVSETAASLAAKLGIGQRRCRGILEQLVSEGLVQRQDFQDIQPIYFRFPSRPAS